jgi:phosphoribosylanthranilate isomerase
MTRIKFCGITRVEDVRAAAELGVHALGFVCVPASKRFVDLDLAAALVSATPAFVSTVGLFQDADADQVFAAQKRARFSMLQFHGHESPEFCQQFDVPYLKAVPMADGPDLSDYARHYSTAHGLLLDSHSLSGLKSGGSGHAFDWQSVRPQLAREVNTSWILAGGLNADNVAAGIRTLQPYAVDVSSGIESAPGVKALERMRAFMHGVRDA